MVNKHDFLKETLEELLKELGFEVSLKSSFEDNKVSFELLGDNLGVLVGYKGETLKSFETLLSLFAYKKFQEKVYVSLDIDGFKKRKEEKLVELAEKFAYEARFKNIPISLTPMNSYERRLVHEAVGKIPGVVSQSEGEGFNRHIVIKPEENQKK